MSCVVYSLSQELTIAHERRTVNTSVIKTGGDTWPMDICLSLLLLKVFSYKYIKSWSLVSKPSSRTE